MLQLDRVVVLCLLLVPSLVEAAPLALTEEHVDVALAYPVATPSGWRLYWNDKDNGQQHDPGDAFARSGPQSHIVRPTGSSWDFTGAASGQSMYLMPQAQAPGLPFVGVGAEGIAPSSFIGGVNLRLTGVTGPGAFSLFQIDSFGGITPFMASANGLDATDTLGVAPGSHAHFFWGFTQPGIYDLTFVASALLPGGGLTTSDPATFRFAIVPEPTALIMAMIAACSGLAARGRQKA